MDLPELELECMEVLWDAGDLTVRGVREHLLLRRPLAYTTVLTVLDRLARKGAVTRRKSGRAHLYRAAYTLAEARQAAVGRLLQHYFGDSLDLLLQYLSAPAARLPHQPVAAEPPEQAPPVALDPTLL